MSVEISGTEDIIRKLEEKLGEKRTTRVVNKALREVGKQTGDILKEEVATYKDTGETYESVVVSNVRKSTEGLKEIKVGFGPGSRWRLVHLNEFGYTRYGKFQRPRGMGKVQSAVDRTKPVYQKVMQKGLGELLK